MALNKEHDPNLEALVRRAAVEIKRANPQFGAPQQSVTEPEFEELERDRTELERIWDALESRLGGPIQGEPAAHAVDEDRGEWRSAWSREQDGNRVCLGTFSTAAPSSSGIIGSLDRSGLLQPRLPPMSSCS